MEALQDAAKSLSTSEEVSDDEYIPAPALSADGASLASPISAEVAHFGAAKEQKLLLENGIAAFNRCGRNIPSKGQHCNSLYSP